MLTGTSRAPPPKALRIAMACPGVGLVQRGFERMFIDMFNLMKNDLDVCLYKGGGTSSAVERKLIFLSRNGWFLKYFPIHKLVGRSAMHVECLTFAISLLLAIRGRNVDIIHCTDPPLARVLYKLRKLFGLKFRLLYTEACAMPPADCPPADHMHQISRITFEQAVEHGIPEHYMSVIPLGIYPENFIASTDRAALRRKFALSDETFVILCVAAINRYHKRIDYLIDELETLEGNFVLWIDGSLDHGDPDLVDYATSALGARCRITHLPTRQVGELFAVADLMVHAAMFEAFGLALVEGASTGLAVITHNAPHFQWLMQNPPAAIDMGATGALADKMQALMHDRQQLATLDNSAFIKQTYSWPVLKTQYLAMYSKVAALPDDATARAGSYGLK